MMLVRNKILTVVLALIVLGGIVYLFSKNNISSETITTTNKSLETFSVKTTDVISTDNISSEGLNTSILLDRVWMTFQDYLSRAHAHDIEGVKTLSYRQSDTCKDKTKEKECFALMDNVYSLGKNFRKEDYKNIWSDEKQAIVFTDPRYDDTEKQYGLVQGFLYFTREKDGSAKLLVIDPVVGWYVDKASSTKVEWVTKLKNLTTDVDKDGLTDNEENCLDVNELPVSQCVKTDFQKRDSKGDGWWDSVRVYINQK